jgi:DNA (cytosine-5)-methyltransferase 1
LAVFGIDFFCGIGGATKGFQNAGIQILKGIDNDPTCRETYEKNCSPSKFVMEDINSLKSRGLMRGIPRLKSDRLVFLACAPCQPFSKSYKKKAHKDDRTDLILRFSEFVKEIRPDVIFVENVPGFRKVDNGCVFHKFLSVLKSEKLRYEVEWTVIDAKTYGVPQTRRRFVMLASRMGKIDFPPVTHGKGLLPYVTVCDAISKYPPISAGASHRTVPNHTTRRLSDLNLERLKKTPEDGGGRKDWPRNLWLDCHKKDGSGHSDVYGRMSWSKPSPTLTCKCNSISNGRFGHPSEDRALSLREAATLQTFPDNFLFYGKASNITRHIGNAVPVLIAEVFGRTVYQHARKNLDEQEPETRAKAHRAQACARESLVIAKLKSGR